MSDLPPQPETGTTFAIDNDPKFKIVGICHMCKHRKGTWTCDAFTERIPNEILGGEVSHTVPYPGDNGITFEVLQP